MKRGLIIAALLVSIAGYSLWPIAWHGMFYQANAVTLILLSCLIVRLAKRGSGVKRVAYIFFLLAVSNLFDEVFFNPLSFDTNEYLFASAIIIHQAYLHYNVRYT